MITVDETQLSVDEALTRHRLVADAMRKLMEDEGWKFVAAKLKQDMELALVSMRSAKTGDESLKACAGYTSCESILRMPEEVATKSLNRIRQIEEAKLVESPPVVHHRSHQFKKWK